MNLFLHIMCVKTWFCHVTTSVLPDNPVTSGVNWASTNREAHARVRLEAISQGGVLSRDDSWTSASNKLPETETGTGL